MADHEFGVVPHDCLRLHVEIPQHFVTPPASNEADDVSVHARTEQCWDNAMYIVGIETQIH